MRWTLLAPLLFCCATPAAPPATIDAPTLYRNFFGEALDLNPMLATYAGDRAGYDRLPHPFDPAWRAKAKALHQRYLDLAGKVDRSRIADEDLAAFDAFVWLRKIDVAEYDHPSDALALRQLGSIHTEFARMGSGAGPHPFETPEDYRAFMARMAEFNRNADEAIAAMRRGASAGVVQPKVIMERVLPQLAVHVVDDPAKSVFAKPLAKLTDPGLKPAYLAAIEQQVIPAYRKLHDFVKEEYLPKTRATVGLSALPGGEAWYRFAAERFTTTTMSPEMIHEIGMREVKRLSKEMKKLQTEMKIEGDLPAFYAVMNQPERAAFASEAEVMTAYEAARTKVDAQIAKLFVGQPKLPFEIKPMEAFRAKAAPSAQYARPSEDGKRPGVFYVNTSNLKAQPKWRVDAVYLHEAVPGHHFQIATAMEAGEIPRFLRYASVGAYIEGWALYAEGLGAPLGLYQTPEQRYGQISSELWRANRLVLDTGLHAKGWTRAQAIEFGARHGAMPLPRVEAEVDRFIAWPGQALSYKIGQLEILRLRKESEALLGDKFDERAFHAAVLEGGPLPMAVLAKKIARWRGTMSLPPPAP